EQSRRDPPGLEAFGQGLAFGTGDAQRSQVVPFHCNLRVQGRPPLPAADRLPQAFLPRPVGPNQGERPLLRHAELPADGLERQPLGPQPGGLGAASVVGVEAHGSYLSSVTTRLSSRGGSRSYTSGKATLPRRCAAADGSACLAPAATHTGTP